jgi:hypothetical protein
MDAETVNATPTPRLVFHRRTIPEGAFDPEAVEPDYVVSKRVCKSVAREMTGRFVRVRHRNVRCEIEVQYGSVERLLFTAATWWLCLHVLHHHLQEKKKEGQLRCLPAP